MEAMLQRHCARFIYVIPDGLRELMSDISREVLRSQPLDTYTFIADYLDALIITRENARVALRMVETLTEVATTTASLLEETGMSREEVDNVVEIIQRTFKKSIDSDFGKQIVEGEDAEDKHIVADVMRELNMDPQQAEAAATIIQQAYHRFKERKDREKDLLSGLVDWRVAARSAIKLYRKTGVTNEEANRAATLIKAAYKSYYTRKMMRKLAEIDPEAYVIAEEEGEEEQQQEEEQEIDESIEPEADEQKDSTPKQSIGTEAEAKRSVKIDYNTVIPHVDFDTTSAAVEVSSPDTLPPKISTDSSVVKYSLGYIFEEALQQVSRMSYKPVRVENVEVTEIEEAFVDLEVEQPENVDVDETERESVKPGEVERELSISPDNI